MKKLCYGGRLQILPLLLLLNGGCASVPKYYGPESGPTAKLRIISPHSVHSFHAAEGNCEALSHIALTNNPLRQRTKEESSIGMPWAGNDGVELPSSHYFEVNIPANKPFHIYYSGHTTTNKGLMKCTGNVDFKPQENGNYEVSLSCTDAKAFLLQRSLGFLVRERIKTNAPLNTCWH